MGSRILIIPFIKICLTIPPVSPYFDGRKQSHFIFLSFYYIQGDQLNIAVFFWNLVKSELSSVRCCTCVHLYIFYPPTFKLHAFRNYSYCTSFTHFRKKKKRCVAIKVLVEKPKKKKKKKHKKHNVRLF